MNTEEMVEKLYEDMYVGRGKSDPPMTTRVAKVEDAIERFARNSSKIVWGLFALFCAVIGDIIVHAVVR